MLQYSCGYIYKMSKLIFLNSSLEQLNEITEKTHNEQILPIAKSIWQKHLQADNPLWNYRRIQRLVCQQRKNYYYLHQ